MPAASLVGSTKLGKHWCLSAVALMLWVSVAPDQRPEKDWGVPLPMCISHEARRIERLWRPPSASE